jgi:hypothetical protein
MLSITEWDLHLEIEKSSSFRIFFTVNRRGLNQNVICFLSRYFPINIAANLNKILFHDNNDTCNKTPLARINYITFKGALLLIA